MTSQIICGNNIELLKKYPDNYFDSIVTDAPYGLGKEPNAVDLMKYWVEKGYHEISGTGFMGKDWDAFVPQPLFWKEAFRVLKHGGHVLSFFGTRTYDWGVMAMRFAGFEVRDTITWHYGSGFPKSHNISKALDKMQGAEREIIGEKKHSRKGVAIAEERTAIGGGSFGQDKISPITIPSTEQAKQWDGWGSALKPASEPIVLARKPLEKGLSIAENVLKWGVGGINIDGCRIGFTDNVNMDAKQSINNLSKVKFFDDDRNELETLIETYKSNGRFPANVIFSHHEDCVCNGTKKVKAIKGGNNGALGNTVYGKFNYEKNNDGCCFGDKNGQEEVENWDCVEDCPIRILHEQSGVSKSSNTKRSRNTLGSFGMPNDTTPEYSDKGGASRFFYIAKSSKGERNKGLENERWFYDLELVFNNCSFTEQNLFIWEQEELNQNTDLNGEAQPKKDISEGIVLLVEDKECYTTLNGKENEVLFPKAIKFTTKTELSQIIELKTLNFYQLLSINDCIADVLETNKENGLSLAENVGIKNLLKLIFTKGHMGFPLGVKSVAKKMPQLINVKDAWQKSNIHSTVKPIKLMQYLVRLITPPNGIVLDPFNGSGTTGIAAKLEGLNYVGLELDPEYCKISEARISAWEIEKPENNNQLSLF